MSNNRDLVGVEDFSDRGLGYYAPLPVSVELEGDLRPDAANVSANMELVAEHVANGRDNSWIHRRNDAVDLAVAADQIVTVDDRKCHCGGWKQKGYDACYHHKSEGMTVES